MFFCEVAYCRGVTFLRNHLKKFKGSQDVEPLVLTPFYLLIGLSIPVWSRFGIFSVEMLTSRANTTFLQSVLPYAGVMTIGVGDACAALIGTSFGRVKLPGSHKTVEGFLGNIAGQALFMVLIGPYLKWGARGANDALKLGSVMVSTSLLEVYTQDIDNLVVPIYAVLCLTVL
jgi:dolichol kinase